MGAAPACRFTALDGGQFRMFTSWQDLRGPRLDACGRSVERCPVRESRVSARRAMAPWGRLLALTVYWAHRIFLAHACGESEPIQYSVPSNCNALGPVMFQVCLPLVEEG
ncbi:hypothetical protein Bbelb_047190 [Branchiostoma belcheri]|nr:hypothetical protein Bbelb_047190 [Branchiostoma belcheri]